MLPLLLPDAATAATWCCHCMRIFNFCLIDMKLFHYCSGRWDDAVRLCRFVKDTSLWSCLAAMSAYAKDLSTAEVAYAAIDEVSGLSFIETALRQYYSNTTSGVMLDFPVPILSATNIPLPLSLQAWNCNQDIVIHYMYFWTIQYKISTPVHCMCDKNSMAKY